MIADLGQTLNQLLIRATKREYQKMGKLMVEGAFGPYAGLVKAE